METSQTQRVSALDPGQRLGIIGAGSMGGALLRGVLASGVANDAVWAATKSAASAAAVGREFGVTAQTTYDVHTATSDVLLVAVKPVGIEAALRDLVAAGLRPETLIVSVAAGVSIERIETALGQKNPVIRSMPNTPSLVGAGMTAIAGGTHATKAHLEAARRLFAAVGLCLTVEERLINAVTAISGSGPAYIYLIIEALADAGVRVGLPRDVAMTLVTQTVLGAATMVAQSDRNPAALRDDVTTPGGCTSAALLVLEDGKLRSVLARAVEEARNVLDGTKR